MEVTSTTPALAQASAAEVQIEHAQVTPTVTSSTSSAQGVSDGKPMDSELWFSTTAVQCNLSDDVLKVLQKTYVCASDFFFAFPEASDTEDLEAFIKSIVIDKDTNLGLEEGTWKRHPMTSRIRRFFKECSLVCKQGTTPAPLPSPTPQAKPPMSETSFSTNTVNKLLEERLPPILSIGDVEKLTEDFQLNFPCEVLTDEVTPSRDYLRRLKHQKNTQGHEWMPWTQIISKTQEQQHIKNKGVHKKRRPLTEGAALFTLFEEEIVMEEGDLSGRPHIIACTLATRAHAMAMLGYAHLAWLKKLNSKMHQAYVKQHEAGATVRNLNHQELMLADQQIWEEIFKSSRQPGWDINAAIDLVLRNGVVDRELAFKPTLPKATLEKIQAIASKGKGKGSTDGSQKRTRSPRSPRAGDKRRKGEVKGNSKGEKQKGKGKGLPKDVEISWNKIDGQTWCERYHTAGIGCNGKGCRFTHACPVKLSNGQVCGEKHPAYRHNAIKGSKR